MESLFFLSFFFMVFPSGILSIYLLVDLLRFTFFKNLFEYTIARSLRLCKIISSTSIGSTIITAISTNSSVILLNKVTSTIIAMCSTITSSICSQVILLIFPNLTSTTISMYQLF